MATDDIAELQAIVAQQQEAIEELRATVNQWRLNGAEDMFGGAGHQRYGGGAMQLDNNGIQLLNDPAGDRAAIFYVPELSVDPAAQSPRAFISGQARPSTEIIPGAQMQIVIRGENNIVDEQAFFRMEVDDFAGEATGLMRASYNGTQANLWAYSLTGGEARIYVDNVPFRLARLTSDPSNLSDGDMWYRSDTDKIRARINSTTENLAREGKLIVGGGSTLTISSGAITVVNGYHHMDTEGGAANDDLDTINGGEEGQILVLSTVADGRKISVTENGNIALSSANMNLDSTEDMLMLMYSGPQSLWLEISRSTNG